MLSLKCNDILGNPIDLYFAKNEYSAGGGEAFLTIDPEGLLEGDNGIYTVLSTNLPENPAAVEWCRDPGHFILDTNNNSKSLVRQLLSSGIVELEGHTVASGFCAYPLASIPEVWLSEIPEYACIRSELEKEGVLAKYAEDLDGWACDEMEEDTREMSDCGDEEER